MSDYDQQEIEKKWQKHWKDKQLYHFDLEKQPVYSIDNPPRYASGALHIGHAVHYTHIDFVARYKRMRGYNVFFPLCFDVNGIPIEERVEKKYGITRKDIDRHKFIKLCEDFAEQNIGEMTNQFYLLGESMDESVYYQTNETCYRRLTQISFIDLYKKGLIYRGEFPVNWCPRCMTAMADAEIEYKDRNTKLNTVKFYLKELLPQEKKNLVGIGQDEKGCYLEIATTRPEMLPTCQLVAIHPTDERASFLVGKKLWVPLFEKMVSLVEDEAVDPTFGTGLVMICTIGDKVDLEWAFKYDLPLDICIDEEGKMTHLAGKYEGLSILDARKAVLDDLKAQRLLTKEEPLQQSIGVCWRCKTPVEFIQTKQYFLKLLQFKQDVLDAADTMTWYPDFMKIRLRDWVNSLKWDWVISRQRYFATPIPLWECVNCSEIVLADPEQCYVDPTIDAPPQKSCPKCGGKLVGCNDVFDTWMDSSISPLYNTFWNRDSRLFTRLYPMSLRPQAHDIIRTWAFYTILRCNLLTNLPPFKEIMMGGFILSPDGTPMHTSVGNVIDPVGIVQEYGSDALRYYAAGCTLGEDNPFRYKDLVRGHRLMKKLWNVEKFIGGVIKDKPNKETLPPIDKWILSLYSKLVQNCTHFNDNFNYTSTLREIEYFLWHEFADHYLEMVKERVYSKKETSALYTLYTIGLGIIKMLAPFLPHITEEIYDRYYKKFEGGESIHVSEWPQPVYIDEIDFHNGEYIKGVVSKIREWKSSEGISLNAPIKKIIISGKTLDTLESSRDIIQATLNIQDLEMTDATPSLKEQVTIKPNFALIGKNFKEKSPRIIQAIQKKDPQEIVKEIEDKGEFTLSLSPRASHKDLLHIPSDFVAIEKKLLGKKKNIDVIKYKESIILLEK